MCIYIYNMYVLSILILEWLIMILNLFCSDLGLIQPSQIGHVFMQSFQFLS